ncbi:MAG: aspartate kinase [Candidatus Kapaibacteriales bacterium]
MNSSYILLNNLVLKFGGTSVRDAECIKQIPDILHSKVRDYNNLHVVVSAFAGITNLLYSAYDKLLSRDGNGYLIDIHSVFEKAESVTKDLNLSSSILLEMKDLYSSEEKKPKNKEEIYGLGERLSSLIISKYFEKTFNDKGIKTILKDSSEYIFTKGGDKDYTVERSYTYKKLEDLRNELSNSSDIFSLFIWPGFIATDTYSLPSILGRGGSDYTAAILSAGLKADKLEIWTDVSGMMTIDPRVNPNSRPISSLSYKEASELAYFGAKVLHPKTILPAIENSIPVVIKNTSRPQDEGTYISEFRTDNTGVKAISFRKDITVVNIVSNRMLGAYGFMKKVFEVFDNFRTPVDLVATTEVSVSVTIDDLAFITDVERELSKFSKVTLENNNSSISLIGEGLGLTAGVAAKAFDALKGINVKMVSFGASDVNLSLVVSSEDLDKALELLHLNLL